MMSENGNVGTPTGPQSGRAASIACLIRRASRKRCPRCGLGRLFSRWYTMHAACSECGLRYESFDGNTWAFMYLSIAGITGVIVVGMLLVTPTDIWLGRAAVFAAAVAGIIGTLPWRKALCIAFDFRLHGREDRNVVRPLCGSGDGPTRLQPPDRSNNVESRARDRAT